MPKDELWSELERILREARAREQLKDPKFALKESEKAAAERAIDLLLRALERGSDFARFNAEGQLPSFARYSGLTDVILERLERHSLNSGVAFSLVSVLGVVGAGDKKAVAKLLSLVDSETAAGEAAKRVFFEHYGERPSRVIDGFFHLLSGRESLETRTVLFFAEFLAYSRQFASLEEAKKVVRGVWRALKYRMDETELRALSNVIAFYVAPVQAVRMLEEPPEMAFETASVGARERQPSGLVDNEKIAEMSIEIIVDFFEKLLKAKGRRFERILNLNRIAVGVCVLMGVEHERNVELLQGLTDRLRGMMDRVSDREIDRFQRLLSHTQRFLNGRRETNKGGGDIIRAGQDPPMHHSFIVRDRLLNQIERGCRVPQKMQREMARKLGVL